jgi:hypothetical protein
MGEPKGETTILEVVLADSALVSEPLFCFYGQASVAAGASMVRACTTQPEPLPGTTPRWMQVATDETVASSLRHFARCAVPRGRPFPLVPTRLVPTLAAWPPTL